MFEAAELKLRISREAFDAAATPLREELLALQEKLRDADFPVLVVFAGVDGGGKSESINLLNEWLDPHWISTHAYGEPTDEELERPRFWRYWRDLPGHGRMGLYLSGWYSRPILDRVYRRIDKTQFAERLERISAFERVLADDGALILKFWMHLGRKSQKKRLKALEADPKQAWRVGKNDWRNWKRYDKFLEAAEQAIRHTDDARNRWILVDAEDHRYRSLTVLTALKDALSRHLAEHKKRRKAKPAVTKPVGPTVLDSLDLSKSIEKPAYEKQWQDLREEIGQLGQRAHRAGLSSVLLFEGWDAAGKGGAIRRLTASLDARLWRVVPTSAPNDVERAHHYLWRFWPHLPRAGQFAIFDRSWYGRVLVERVEGFARPEEWRRAFAEINDFEGQLLHHGVLLAKFWLHISPEEQYRRFQAREQVAYKQWKLTEEDWRNRAKWDDYTVAVHDMVQKTGGAEPWVLIEGNDKNFARLKILRDVAERLRERLA